MIQIHLADADRQELQRLKKEGMKPCIRLKAEVVLLKDMGYSQTEISKIAFIKRNTVQNHLKLYLGGGLSQLIEDKRYRPKSKLEPDKEKIKAHFEKNPAISINHAIDEIEKISGHRMSPTRTRLFMKKIGLKFLKTGSIPAKQADEKKQIEQEEFKKKTLEPLIAQAQENKIQLFFMDAAHFVLGSNLSYLWSFVRCFILTSAGRQRHNVLAALNYSSKKILLISNDNYINSQSVCDLLHLINGKKYKFAHKNYLG